MFVAIILHTPLVAEYEFNGSNTMDSKLLYHLLQEYCFYYTQRKIYTPSKYQCHMSAEIYWWVSIELMNAFQPLSQSIPRTMHGLDFVLW